MFDANFDFDTDFSEASQSGRPVQWVIKTTAPPDRQALKQQRRESRGDGQNSGKKQTSPNSGKGHPARSARGLERKRRNAAEQVRHKNEPKDPSISWLPAESEEGNIEYKLRLKDPGAARLEQLVRSVCPTAMAMLPQYVRINGMKGMQQITQMKFRLSEGQGECIYYVGVEDGGYPRGLSDDDLRLSLNNLNYMASALKATATIACLFQGAMGRSCARVQVQRNCVEDVHYLEMRVAVGGSVGSGKSSLVAVLTHGVDGEPLLDDGRGKARTAVFRHKHEIQSGHTSSISQSMLGYDSTGKVLNYLGVNSLTATEISAAAQKVLHFIDLCGHSRFLRTALYGLTSLLPDCLMFCVCAQTGVNRTAREHLAAALALDVPVFAVVTKTDQVDDATLASTLLETRLLLAMAADTATAARVVDVTGHTTDDTTDVELSAAADIDGAVFTTDDDVTRSSERRSQAQKVRLDKRAPVVETVEKAAAVAQLMCILQQHHHPLLCRSYMVPCFLTSSTTGMGIPLLHCFLRGLQQAPRRKQPVDISRRRRLFESYNGRVAPGIPDPPSYPWPRPPQPPTRSTSQHSTHSSASQSSNTPLVDGSKIEAARPLSPTSPLSVRHSSSIVSAAPLATEAAPAPAQPDASALESPCAPIGQAKKDRAGSSARWSAEAVQSIHAQVDVSNLNTPTGPQQGSSVPVTDLAHFQIDHMFEVSSVGTVFSGTVVSGNIELGNTLWWGPHETSGEFSLVSVKGIHRSRVPVSKVAAGQCATIAIDQQISKTASGTICVQQPGRTSHEHAVGEVDLFAATQDSTGALRSGKRMSEPSMPGSVPAVGSQCRSAVQGDREAGAALDSCRRHNVNEVAIRRSSDGASKSMNGQAIRSVAGPHLDNSALMSPSSVANGAWKAAALPACEEAESSEAGVGSCEHAGIPASLRNKEASRSQSAVGGSCGDGSLPVAVPSKNDSHQKLNAQGTLLKDVSQDCGVAVSFSDTLEVPSCQGGPDHDRAAQNCAGGVRCELAGNSSLEFSGFAQALTDGCQQQVPGAAAAGAQEAGAVLDGGRGADISLSLDPSGAPHASAPHAASQKLPSRVWSTDCAHSKCSADGHVTSFCVSHMLFLPDSPLDQKQTKIIILDSALNSLLKCSSFADETTILATEATVAGSQGAGFADATPLGGQLQENLDMHKSRNSSDASRSRGLLAEGIRSFHGEGGLNMRAGSPVLSACLSPIHGQQPLPGEVLKRLSESLPQQVQMSASPDAFGDSSWNDVGLQLAGLPTGEVESTAASKSRKGTVLLDNRVEPRAVVEACAYMILTNGQWPPRGLLSGRWPPEEEDSGTLIQGRTRDTQVLETRSNSREKQQATDTDTRARFGRRTRYRHIIHCRSIRQEVEIDTMQEIPVDLEKERFEVDGVNLSAASAAAAILFPEASADDEACAEDGLIGAVVDVTFTLRKPEWLMPGLRFVLRDQHGGVSAAGVIRSLPVE